MTKTVSDVMQKSTAAVSENTTYKQIIRRMHASGSSSLPVVDADGRIAGVVSESDVLLKESFGPEDDEAGRIERWRYRVELAKAGGIRASEIMEKPVVTLSPAATLDEAAWAMYENGILRIPVVDDGGRLAGQVSWRDLLQIFLRPDAEIREEIEREILGRMALEPGTVTADVREGVVVLVGQLESAEQVPVLTDRVRTVEGVVGIEPHLSFGRERAPSARNSGV